MADKKISQLPASTVPLAGTEVLPIVQGTTPTTKQVSVADLTAGRAISATQYTSTIATGTAPLIVASTTEVANLKAATATLADSATSANAVKSNATTGVLQVTGPAAASTRVMTTPDANFTVARTDAAQTFTGDQTFSSNLVIGTSGKGANFTANTPASGMTSQLLNWYEEGTWTPVLKGSGTAGTYETTQNFGKYTRIGNTVTLSCYMLLTGAITGGGTGTLIITGAPFTKASNSDAPGAAFFSNVTFTAGTLYPVVSFGGAGTSSTLYIRETHSGGALTAMPISGVTNSSVISFSITYMV